MEPTSSNRTVTCRAHLLNDLSEHWAELRKDSGKTQILDWLHGGVRRGETSAGGVLLAEGQVRGYAMKSSFKWSTLR